MFIRKTEYEDMIMMFNKKIRELTEENRKLNEECALTYSSAIKATSLYGTDVVDKFHTIYYEMVKRK